MAASAGRDRGVANTRSPTQDQPAPATLSERAEVQSLPLRMMPATMAGVVNTASRMGGRHHGDPHDTNTPGHLGAFLGEETDGVTAAQFGAEVTSGLPSADLAVDAADDEVHGSGTP